MQTSAMLTTYALLIAHHLVLVLLLLAGAMVPACALRGRIVETVAASAEAAILWYAGRMLAADLGDTEIALASYAPFVGASVAFVLLTLGAPAYEKLESANLLRFLPTWLQRAFAWQFAPSQTGAPPR